MSPFWVACLAVIFIGCDAKVDITEDRGITSDLRYDPRDEAAIPNSKWSICYESIPGFMGLGSYRCISFFYCHDNPMSVDCTAPVCIR